MSKLVLSPTFIIAKKRKLKLHRRFIDAWKESNLSPRGEGSISTLQRAFSSIHTSDEIRNAVINATFNHNVDYGRFMNIQGLGIEVTRTKTGQPYLK